MTKDRRLGRGLAALLGTSLDEPMEGAGAPRSQPAPRPLASTPQAATPHSAVRAATATAPSAAVRSPAAPHDEAMSDDRGSARSAALTSATTSSAAAAAVDGQGTGTSRQSVTGAVPLHRNEPIVSNKTLELSVYEIDNNPFQPRRKFHEEEIASLAESIREHEQLQPILVRKVGQRYQLISGERRLRATIHAGLNTIRAEVREADDRLVAELAIVENLQRKDLDPIEKALSFRRYIDEHKCRQDDLAKRLKIDRSTIANLMRLLELPTKLQEWIQEDKLTSGHARTLLPLGDEQQQLEFAHAILEEGWTVRETERRVSEQLKREDGEFVEPQAAAGKSKSKKASPPQIAALEQQLRLALGTKIEIKQSANGRGKITISFSNSDEFERLREVLAPPANRRVA